MYDFRDTMEKGDALAWRSPETLSLDGVYIEDVVPGYATLTVTGRESLDYKIDDDDRPTGVDGMTYYGKRLPAREITVVFRILADSAPALVARFRKLANFVKGENRSIRFADEPTAHYTGTIKSIDAPDAGALNVTSSMVFYCADPHLTSDEIRKVPASNVNGVLMAKISNTGSAITYPIIRVQHSTENGYIGIASKDGAFEMGNIEEVDGVNYEQSEILSNKLSDFTPYTGVNPQAIGADVTGTLTVNSTKEMVIGAKPITSGLHGGLSRFKLPADSNGEIGAANFYAWCGIKFVAAKSQTGLIQILFTDENDEFIFGYGAAKFSRTNTSGLAFAWTGDSGKAGGGEYKRWGFDTRDTQKNPFGSKRGSCDVLKTGDRVRFYYDRKYYWTSLPAGKKVAYAYVYIGKYGTDSSWPDMRAGKIQFYIRKDQVEKFNDIPNRYSPTSEVVINSENDTITIDGLPSNDEMVTGSEFFTLSPGDNTLEFAVSSWCAAPPTIMVEYQERWL